MNYADEIRHKLYEDTSEPITAVIYARVSTDNEGQKESCANQVELANNFIAKHPNIKVVGTYVDDGISAKNDFTRSQYTSMLEQIDTGNIDIIIAKALSRLNRNDTSSSILKELCIKTSTTIFTLEDNVIQDFDDPNAEMMYGFKSIMDAQYVRKQSINGKKTQELRCERKELSAKDCQSYGYAWHKDTKSISINEDEAITIRKIFEEYVYRNGTPASIHKALKAAGINISERTISNMIQDERYIGKFYINKRTSKLGTGQTKSKRILLPKEKWVLVERPDLQIVDTDLFIMAQRLHQTRITFYAKPDTKIARAHFQGTHKYAGKIFCPVCGKPYHYGYADRNKTHPIYRIKTHGDCSNPIGRIDEADMEEITRQALKTTLDQQDEVCKTLELILAECVEASQNSSNEISRLKQQKKTLEKQSENLITALSNLDASNKSAEVIMEKLNTITAEIDTLSKTIKNKETNKLSNSYVSEKIAEINSAITELRNFTEINRDRIINYIERIELPANGDVNILLKSGQMITIVPIETTESSDDNVVVKLNEQDVLYS